jgi:thioredoxin 1
VAYHNGVAAKRHLFLFGRTFFNLGNSRIHRFMSSALEVTDKTFEQEVKQADTPVLVDFWAPWCGPCKALGPVIDELATEYAGKVKIVKINTDENVETAQSFRISGIPSLLVFKNGEMVEQMVGLQKKSALSAVLDKHLTN